MIRFRIIIEEGYEHGFTENYHNARIPTTGKATEVFEKMLANALAYVKDHIITEEEEQLSLLKGMKKIDKEKIHKLWATNLKACLPQRIHHPRDRDILITSQLW